MSSSHKKKSWLSRMLKGTHSPSEEDLSHNTAPSLDPLLSDSIDLPYEKDVISGNTLVEDHQAIMAQSALPQSRTIESTAEPSTQHIPAADSKKSLLTRLKTQLEKTRTGITTGFTDLFMGKKTIDDDILEELETRLLMADVGINATQKMLDHLSGDLARKTLTDAQQLFAALEAQMGTMLAPVEIPLLITPQTGPFVILMVGVNGVGKTTTIGKLAKKFQAEGKSVMLAAGDTFRAAAVDQLKVWGERNAIPVIAQKEGADPASVIFDALESAKAKNIDVLIADTAGRLHTQAGLMQELAKINRVIKRVDANAPHETMLVVDASTGQNALTQAVQFNEIAPLSGITFTKLDGTAKGGIVFAIAEKLNIPIRYIGVGESIDDLRVFNAKEFIQALIGTNQKGQ